MASLFHSGLAPRALAACLYALLAFGSVAMLERAAHEAAAPTPAAAAPAPAGTPREARERLVIESVAPIARWTVRFDGVEATPERVGTHRWEAAMPDPGPVIASIDAAPAADGPSGANALRLLLESTTGRAEHTAWVGPGGLLVIPLDHLDRGVEAGTDLEP